MSQELTWRGFVNQTTYKDVTAVDGDPITFYWGVDPSADSMTIGNLAAAMMVHHFMSYGHKAILLVGGATGLIGDPDGKTQERDLKSLETIASNKAGIVAQYQRIFDGLDFEVVDNYDWFSGLNYIDFLRDVGKHVPISQMLGREFVQSRLGENGSGISYAEFSYSLIQGYDYLHLHRERAATLQVCGADQWGNSIAGVDLIRRVTGDEAHVWSTPLVINKSTGVKFGKSESGAIWLDASKTSPTQLYQFCINLDDEGVADYLKIFTLLSPEDISEVMQSHEVNRQARSAQTRLAAAVTQLVHGNEALSFAETVTAYLTGRRSLVEATDDQLVEVRRNLPSVTVDVGSSIITALVDAGLCQSASDARRMLAANAISINDQKSSRDIFTADDFQNGRLLLRRGKAYKDSALIERAQ
ncbi:MAG: tyrosine--tRNA ligase [Candidatus Saccharimonadales bacterium]